MADDSTDIAVVVKSAEEFAERLMKKLTLDITANLIEDTPVDTGWARANWVPEIGQPYDITYKDMSREERSQLVTTASSAQASGLNGIAEYQLPLGEIYITNNVPYIVLLNEGSSRQAPAAYVQACIERGLQQNASGEQ